MEGFKFSLRDIPKREVFEELSGSFKGININAVESFLALLKTASDLSSRLDEHFDKYSISEGKFTILMLLYRQSDHQLSPLELAKKSEVSKGTMTGLIAGLNNQGFIEKIPNIEDTRRYFVRLTTTGLNLLEEILPNHYVLIGQLMSGLDESQQKKMTQLLKSLSNTINK